MRLLTAAWCLSLSIDWLFPFLCSWTCCWSCKRQRKKWPWTDVIPPRVPQDRMGIVPCLQRKRFCLRETGLCLLLSSLWYNQSSVINHVSKCIFFVNFSSLSVQGLSQAALLSLLSFVAPRPFRICHMWRCQGNCIQLLQSCNHASTGLWYFFFLSPYTISLSLSKQCPKREFHQRNRLQKYWIKSIKKAARKRWNIKGKQWQRKRFKKKEDKTNNSFPLSLLAFMLLLLWYFYSFGAC